MSVSGWRLAGIGYALLTCVLLPSTPVGPLAAQADDRQALEAYYDAVGRHFGVPPAEVEILSEWRLPPDEIPVVLDVASRGGISPDAVVALRRAGAGWAALARRYALDASSFHVRVDGDPGSLARVLGEYATRPSTQWSAIQLSDADVIGLVNLRVLSVVLAAPTSAVLRAHDRDGSWVAAYRALSPRR